MRALGLFLFMPLVWGWSQKTIPGRDPQKTQVLILTGYNMHDWRTITASLRDLLERTGRMEVRVNEEPQGAASATFEGYDVIVLNYSNYMLRFGPTWPETTREALLEFVRSGKGLVAFHGSLSAFAEWPEYERLTGGAWREGSAHAPYHTFQAKVIQSEHPITRGMPPVFQQSDEISHGLRMHQGNDILVTAFDDPANCTSGPVKICGSGREEPLAWTHRYGQGRVFTTLLGHDMKSISSDGFRQLFLRGVEWAAGKR